MPQERARIFAPGRALVAYVVKSDWRCLLTGWGLYICPLKTSLQMIITD